MLERAPQVGEYLSDPAAAQFIAVQEGLKALGIDFEIAPRLVRGLDYYTGTTFELPKTWAARRSVASGSGWGSSVC